MRGLVRFWGTVRVKDELEDSRAVPQVDEDQAAVVTAPVHPAGHPGLAPGALCGELAAPGVAVVVRERGLLHPLTPGGCL